MYKDAVCRITALRRHEPCCTGVECLTADVSWNHFLLYNSRILSIVPRIFCKKTTKN